ncbi:GNAT family N-acetyltransferase [Shimia sagamensis]|uniref:Acetyltransferase (GNAT) family protein n=1 Tax=Shimia sagamensis TaxID=1566352 RepID=A0ABY1NT17_9RHOB|nr:GNAT family N-acetyltransferase [Shimia sagamensis]SMP17389.1 Acetyltransferase (GNAT) family protein [Shimia sagamensis]
MADASQPRLARADEAPAIARLIDAAYQPYRDLNIALPDVSGGVTDAIEHRQVWVMDNLSGVLMLSTTPPTAHLMNVAVASQARGRGLGGVLIRFALKQAQDAECQDIALATHVDMPDNVALYAHLGWHETERDETRVMMVRPLP